MIKPRCRPRGGASPGRAGHLVIGACPSGQWRVGDLVTHNQDGRGTIGTPAASLLVNHLFSLHRNGSEIGNAGAGGNSEIFTTPEAVP